MSDFATVTVDIKRAIAAEKAYSACVSYIELGRYEYGVLYRYFRDSLKCGPDAARLASVAGYPVRLVDEDSAIRAIATRIMRNVE